MSKSTKRTVRGISVLIVFLALAVTILQIQRKDSKVKGFNYKESQNEYRDLKYINKATIALNSLDSAKAMQTMDEIMNNQAQKRIRRQVSGGNGAFLFTVNQSELAAITQVLGELGTISSYTEQVDTSLVNLDYEGEHNRLSSYEKEQNDLSNVRFPSDAQNRRKEALHALIQQSRNNLEKLKNSENVLLYITLSSVSKRGNLPTQIKTWVIMYLNWLVIFAIAAVIVYFGARFLMYLLTLLGIKSIGSVQNGSYNYMGGYYKRYSGYYSNYGRGRRKTKRIYKDKEPKSKPEE